MRAVCESCGRPQPPDWKAGDLCPHCGAAARSEARCFWCVKWTPAARFCRSCGAEVVPPALYGAARMLKDAGTDRFAIPKMLRELDPEQVENFSRIYQRHAVAVARHADEARFLERFLHHKGFGAAIEEELVPQLPWPEEALKLFSGPPLPPGDDLATAKAIEAATPLPATRSLAALVRLRLDDWKALRDALGVFASSDGTLRTEAALVLTGWRVRTAAGPFDEDRALLQAIEDAPFPLEVAVRKARLGKKDPDRLREALASQNPETAFAAALALGDVDRLENALRGDEMEVIAAGRALAAMDLFRPLQGPLLNGSPDVQHDLIEAILRRKKPAPELSEALLRIVETTTNGTVRERAARLLCRKIPPEWALRVARAAGKERSIFQSLLSEGAGLPPETGIELAAFMVENGLFTMSQYGLSDAGRRGTIPDGFVPRHFERADAETRGELLRLAEEQLKARGDEALHRFVMNVLFGPYPAGTRKEAWWALSRWYVGIKYGSKGPMAIRVEAIERFFGSVPAFVPKLTAVVRDPATLKEVGVMDFLADLFDEADPEAVPALLADEAAARDLVKALLGILTGDFYVNLRTGAVKLLGLVGAHPAWRDEVIAELDRLRGKEGYDLTYWSERMIRRLKGEPEV